MTLELSNGEAMKSPGERERKTTAHTGQTEGTACVLGIELYVQCCQDVNTHADGKNAPPPFHTHTHTHTNITV